jgi:uncharacterized membrane protein (Fun14 family)
MTDTNDRIRSVLLTGLTNPWCVLGFLLGLIAGYAFRAVIAG